MGQTFTSFIYETSDEIKKSRKKRKEDIKNLVNSFERCKGKNPATECATIRSYLNEKPLSLKFMKRFQAQFPKKMTFAIFKEIMNKSDNLGVQRFLTNWEGADYDELRETFTAKDAQLIIREFQKKGSFLSPKTLKLLLKIYNQLHKDQLKANVDSRDFIMLVKKYFRNPHELQIFWKRYKSLRDKKQRKFFLMQTRKEFAPQDAAEQVVSPIELFSESSRRRMEGLLKTAEDRQKEEAVVQLCIDNGISDVDEIEQIILKIRNSPGIYDTIRSYAKSGPDFFVNVVQSIIYDEKDDSTMNENLKLTHGEFIVSTFLDKTYMLDGKTIKFNELQKQDIHSYLETLTDQEKLDFYTQLENDGELMGMMRLIFVAQSVQKNIEGDKDKQQKYIYSMDAINDLLRSKLYNYREKILYMIFTERPTSLNSLVEILQQLVEDKRFLIVRVLRGVLFCFLEYSAGDRNEMFNKISRAESDDERLELYNKFSELEYLYHDTESFRDILPAKFNDVFNGETLKILQYIVTHKEENSHKIKKILKTNNKIEVNKQMMFTLVSKLQNVTPDKLQETCTVMHNTVNENKIVDYDGFLNLLASIDNDKIDDFFDILKYLLPVIQNEQKKIKIDELKVVLRQKYIIS